MSSETNPMDTLSVEAAAERRRSLMETQLARLLSELRQPVGGVTATERQLAMADVFEELAVLNVMVMRVPEMREAVVAVDNDIASLLRVTADAAGAYSEHLERGPSLYRLLGPMAEDFLLLVLISTDVADYQGRALGYRLLFGQLYDAGMGAAEMLSLIDLINSSYLVRGRGRFGDDVVGRIESPASES
jgi:hypothetical protein